MFDWRRLGRRIIWDYVPRSTYKQIRRYQFDLQSRAAGIFATRLQRYRHQPHADFIESSRWVFARGNPTDRGDIPRRIWLFWEQPPAPFFIRACYEDIRRKNPDFEVTLITGSDAVEWVPEYADWPTSMLGQHKANLLRLYLIYRYGGIWLDSSVVLGESLDWVCEWQAEAALDFIGFHNNGASPDPDRPTIENWFLAAPAGHPYLSAWIEHLRPQAVLGAAGLFAALKSHPAAEYASQFVPNPKLRVMFIAGAVALERSTDFRMGLLRVGDEAFAIVQNRSSNDWEVAINWLFRPAPVGRQPAVSKLTQKDRGIVEAYLFRGLYIEESLIGRVIDNRVKH